MDLIFKVLSSLVLVAAVLSENVSIQDGGFNSLSQTEPMNAIQEAMESNPTKQVHKTILVLNHQLRRYSNFETEVDELGETPYGKVESGSEFYKDGIHGFINAIHYAFSYHLDLQISPDHIWTLFMFSIGDHININPEKYRKVLGVFHEGKREIRIIHDSLTRYAKPGIWAKVFPLFESELRKQTASGVGSNLTLHFSTTTNLDRIVRSIALMGALQSYYDYVVWTRCGIPQVIILGSVEDWNLILQTLMDLPVELGLSDWTKKVIPLIKKFIEAIESPKTVSVHFWKSIYKYESHSGGFTIDGWILDLFPNIQGQTVCDWKEFKTGYTAVPFLWQYLGQPLDMEFVAGFSKHSVINNSVIPNIAWGVYQGNQSQCHSH